MATNDTLEKQGTKLNLEANGGAITTGLYVQANDDTITASDDTGFPFVRFILELTYGTAPTAGAPVALYKRSLNIIDTTDDEAVPDDDNQAGFLWSTGVDNVTTTQRWVTPPLPRDTLHEMEIYLYNGDGTQSISAGWKLDAVPVTLGPSA